MKPGPEDLHHQLLITGEELWELKRQSWSMAGGPAGTRSAVSTSPVQVYLSFLRFRGRREKAAQAVLDEVIKTTW